MSEPTTPPTAEPRRPSRLRTIIITVGVTLIVVLIAGDALKSAASSLYHAVFGDDSGEHAADGDYYTCGMHPWVVLPHPGDCPICNMKLEKLDPSKFSAEIAISPVVTQNMGVRVTDVVRAPLTRSLRTVGTVDYDETLVRDVNLKVAGWLEEVSVDYLGAPVAAGDPLFELYSPELYSAQEEYLSALRRGTPELVAAARGRLELFDVGDAEVQAFAARGTPEKAMTIASRWSGVVVEKHANEGMRVEPGTKLYRIADMSRVWVMVSLYEYQLPFVSEGQTAIMTLPYFPGQEFEGRVIYIYPTLDERTREVKARVEFDNPHGLLKPGMFASVELRATLARDRVVVPREAVIDTGERQVAFVSLGEGRFEPRDVRLGAEGDGGVVEVLDGLDAGEKVVTSGQFLLDSEARMREGLAKMIRGDLAADQEATVAVAEVGDLVPLPAAADAALADLLDAYFTIQETLSGDSTDGAAAAGDRIAKAVDALLDIEIPDHPHSWHRHDEVATIRGEAIALTKAPPIADARLAFADLSVALSKLVRATGVPKAVPAEVQELHCPMYREDQGGTIWLQPAGDVHNPYYGAKMLECFDERAALPKVGGASAPRSGTDDTSNDDAPPAMPDDAPMDGQGDSHGATAEPVTLPAPASAALADALRAYLRVQDALASDSTDGVADAAKAFTTALGTLADTPVPDHPHFWHQRQEQLDTLKANAAELAANPTLADARDALAVLSEALVAFVAATGVPPGSTPRSSRSTARCTARSTAARPGFSPRAASETPITAA